MIDLNRYPTVAQVLSGKPVKKAKLEFISYMGDEPLDDSVLDLIPDTDALKDYVNDEYAVTHKFVAYLGGKPVGLSTIEPLRAQSGEIVAERNPNTDVIQLFVSKKARGSGIGEKLLKRAIEDSEAEFHAGYVHHSDAFTHLAKKYGIRDLDDVQERSEDDEGWQRNGTYEDSED